MRKASPLNFGQSSLEIMTVIIFLAKSVEYLGRKGSQSLNKPKTIADTEALPGGQR
jgi:hypothetical protein